MAHFFFAQFAAISPLCCWNSCQVDTAVHLCAPPPPHHYMLVEMLFMHP